MNKMTDLRPVSMGLLFDSRAHDDILSDLRIEWVKIVIAFELETILQHRFPGQSYVAPTRWDRWMNELQFISLEVRLLVESRWRALAGRSALLAFKNRLEILGTVYGWHAKVILKTLRDALSALFKVKRKREISPRSRPRFPSGTSARLRVPKRNGAVYSWAPVG
jgi:hypothetical protein